MSKNKKKTPLLTLKVLWVGGQGWTQKKFQGKCNQIKLLNSQTISKKYYIKVIHIYEYVYIFPTSILFHYSLFNPVYHVFYLFSLESHPMAPKQIS